MARASSLSCNWLRPSFEFRPTFAPCGSVVVLLCNLHTRNARKADSTDNSERRARKRRNDAATSAKNKSEEAPTVKICSTGAKNLKKRTRSSMPFDWELYRRYAQLSNGNHMPAMLGEVLHVFRGKQVPGLRSFVDCTLGAGGHSVAIIEAHKELQLYIGLDVDPLAHEMARSRIETLLNGQNDRSSLKAYTHVKNFKYIKTVLSNINENLVDKGVDGILMDLGLSSMQVDCSERGFSLLADGPLDMRMNPKSVVKADDILNLWPEAEIGRILREYGEESNWRTLQKKIVDARNTGCLRSTSQLVNLVRSSTVGSGGRQGWIKTATRVFQALRIAVNDELRNMEDALHACFDSLSPGGRLAVISFHSLEDRIVKKAFLNFINNGDGSSSSSEDDEVCGDELLSSNCDRPSKQVLGCDECCGLFSQKLCGKEGIILTKRPITPSTEEERLNRKCRSAKLRVVEKV